MTETEPTAAADVIVYTRPGCPYSWMLRRGLRRADVHLEERNIWDDPEAAAFVRSVADGNETVPTVVVDGTALVNPPAAAVIARLDRSAGSPREDHRRPAGSEGMVRATWNGAVLAESGDTVVVEGNHYFPPEALNRENFAPSDHSSVCPWKGQASYYDVVVDGQVNRAAAWYYPDPEPAAEEIRDRVAFWHGVRVEADGVQSGLLARVRRLLTG